MASRDPIGNKRIEEVVSAGQAALEDSRYEDAANQFRAALRMGARSGDEEAGIRCRLSEALEMRSLHREQLETVAKYDKFTEFARLSEPSAR